MVILEETRKMKKEAVYLAASSAELRNQALARIAEAIRDNRETIFAANREDLKNAAAADVPPAIQKRLLFDEHKMDDVIAGIMQLIDLPDPVGQIQLHRELDNGLVLLRRSCPIGIIGVIFEARPDALVQISALCIKSGNCAVLKGGRETVLTNRALFEVIHGAAIAAGLPKHCLLQVEQHNEIDELLSCGETVDLLIPRGSNAFVQYIMNNTKIPVMGHADGICHIFVDAACDQEKAIPVLIDAKTQYPSACNAVETILVHRRIADEFLPRLSVAFSECGVAIHGTEEVAKRIPCEIMEENQFNTEYLDLEVSVKIVEDVEEAVAHINRFGSHHTDCILTEDADTAAIFMSLVDSAGVYQNCSTRFADGFRYGFGAEVGISTGKIHARGPVGLEGLVTYQYRLVGNGHIVGDYASGKRSFTHRDL